MIDQKMDKWLKNLQLFGINADIHCSREEKALGQDHIGTRYVNLAYHDMIKHMHMDLGYQYDRSISQPVVIDGGRQVLLFSIGDEDYYTDLTLIHELVVYPTPNYKEIAVRGNLPMASILNWYEGLVPVIYTDVLMNKPSSDHKYLLVYDVGKEIFAFTISNFYQKYEINSKGYGKSLTLMDKTFEFMDLSSFELELINCRMKWTKD